MTSSNAKVFGVCASTLITPLLNVFCEKTLNSLDEISSLVQVNWWFIELYIYVFLCLFFKLIDGVCQLLNFKRNCYMYFKNNNNLVTL